MASLQVLRKRYKSIQATYDMAFAMKTASSVKFAKVSKVLNNVSAYSKACDNTLALFGNNTWLARHTKTVKTRNCFVLLTNNRGFCGGFNGELLRFFEKHMAEESEPPLLFVFGQKGHVFCNARGFAYESMPFQEIPSYSDAEALTLKLLELYQTGEVNQVIFFYQYYKNMMTQVPTAETILPRSENTAAVQADEILFLPDMESAMKTPSMLCLVNSVYGIILGHCAGIQAATSIAMRSACDNAEESLGKLEIMINRIRQAEVTNSVIETSSFMVGQMN